MKIACIGWGSLIWRPEKLKIQNHWFEDGPLLPIEFTRISKDNRVTLIIDNEANYVRALWTLMTVNNFADARNSLMERENAKNPKLIQSIGLIDEPNDKIHNIIKDWLDEKKIDYAVWTGLSFSDKTRKTRPDIDTIINHLRNLEYQEKKHAEEYIRKAPRQIDTEYRRQLELTFGWTPID